MRKIFVLALLACSLLLCAAAQAAQITDVKWGVNKENVLRFVVDLTDTAGYAVDMEGSTLNLTVNASKNSAVAAQGRIKSTLATSYEVLGKEQYTIVRVPLNQRLAASNYKAFTLKKDPATNRPFRVVLDITPNASSVKSAAQQSAAVVSSRPVVSNRPTRPAGTKPATNSTVTKQNTAANTTAKAATKTTAGEVKKAESAKNETKQTTVTTKKETKQPAKTTTKSEAKSSAPAKVVTTSNTQTKIVASGKYRTSGGLEGKIITLDPGHGGSDPGAIGSDGTKEKDITLPVSKMVKELLEKKGAKVYMTRTTDVDVYGPNASDVEELQARVNVGEKYNSDLFISLHVNSSVNKNVGGFSTYYYPKTNNDIRIAKAIQDQLTANFGVDDLGVRQANFYVIKRISMPATLVEMCFISNEKELVLMKGKWFQNKTARLIVAGIEKYFA